MSADPPESRIQQQVEDAASSLFEPKLRELNLGIKQIEAQDLVQLEESLLRINDVLLHPEQFGTVRVRVSSNAAVVVVAAKTEAQVEVGILPTLLVRKRLILDRIKFLRPEDQLETLRQEIARRVKDKGIQEDLLRVLDKQLVEEQQQSSRIEKEENSLRHELESVRQVSVLAVAMSEFRARLDAVEKRVSDKADFLDKSVTKLEDKAVSKWDVVTIVFTTLAALGGIVAAALGIAKWISG